MIRLFRLLGVLLMAHSLPSAAAAQTPGAPAKVLVFGASGQLGAEVVKSLLASGHAVTAFVRPGSKNERLAGLKIATVAGDVLKDADVAAAFKSASFDVAVDALARGEAGPEFYDLSQQLIATWAKTTGVKQVILHGSVGAGKSRAIYPEARWPAMKDTLQAKERGENHLIASGVAYTIIRNAQLPPSTTPATGKAALFEDETKFGAVTRADLGVLTAGCVLKPACFNKIYHAVDESLPTRR